MSSKGFITGTQTSFHFIRMFFQSLKRILGISIGVAAIMFVLHLIQNADSYPFRPTLFFKYMKVLFEDLLGLDTSITYLSFRGSKDTVPIVEYIYWYENVIWPAVFKFSKMAAANAIKWFFITFIFSLVFFILKGVRLNRKKHLRGMRIAKARTLKKLVFFSNLKSFCLSNYKIGGFTYPNNSELQHTLITGGSGTGKTQATLDLVAQIRAQNGKAIIYDKMGVFVRKFYDPDKDIILNPYDQRTHNWKLFKEARQKYEFESIANSLISATGSDPYWSNAARAVFTIACTKLSGGKKQASIKELRNILMKTDIEEFCDFFKGTDAASLISKDAEKATLSIRSVIGTYLNSLGQLEKIESEEFSIRDWISDDNKKGFLFLTSRSDMHESIKPLLSLWLELAVQSLTSLDQELSRKIWFFIDELPSLQKLSSLKSGLAEARQYGGCFVITVQLMSQLREIYGRDGTMSIFGLCKNKLIFNLPDEDSARFASDNLGRMEVLSNKENISYGAHEVRDGVSMYEQKELKNLVLPSEILSLKDLEFFISFSKGFPVSRSKLSICRISNKAEKLIRSDILDDLEVVEDDISNSEEEEKTITTYTSPDDDYVDDEEGDSQESNITISEKQLQDNIILGLIESEAKEGRLYIPGQFAQKFEDQKGLKSKSLISSRISTLSTSGKILYSRDWSRYGFEKISTKLGLMLVVDMVFKNQDGEEVNMIATHFKHQGTGSLIPVDDVAKDEVNVPNESPEETNEDEDIVVIEDTQNTEAKQKEAGNNSKIDEDII